jgi:L-asparaginase II
MAQTPLRPSFGARKPARQTLPPALSKTRYPRNVAAPVLVEFHRGPFVESRHRGHVVQVNVEGKVEQGIGDPDLVTSLRSAVKPFGVAALLEAGGAEAFHLTDPEIAVMSASHHGEDAHVRTIQAMLRRSGLTQSLLACGTAGAPEDAVTAARLAREGETPGAIRHNCSGFHTASLLMAKLGGYSVADYWKPDHPTQVAMSEMVARIFGVRPTALVTAVDQCGVLTYAFPLVAIARAYALLADPASAADAARAPLVPHLTRIRDAMMAAPEMIGGAHNSPDTMLMRARPGLLVMKGGAEGLRGIGLLPGARGTGTAAAGVAIKIEDGDLAKRANRAVTVEALSQLRVLSGAALERVSELHRPPMVDPRGVEIAQAVPSFRLAPLSELG